MQVNKLENLAMGNAVDLARGNPVNASVSSLLYYLSLGLSSHISCVMHGQSLGYWKTLSIT
jgi:hypothetical protein